MLPTAGVHGSRLSAEGWRQWRLALQGYQELGSMTQHSGTIICSPERRAFFGQLQQIQGARAVSSVSNARARQDSRTACCRAGSTSRRSGLASTSVNSPSVSVHRTAVTVPSSSAARSEESEGSLKIQRPSSTLVSMTMRGKVGTTVSIGVNRRSAVTPRPSETAQELYQLAEGIEAISVPDMAQRLLAKGRAA